MHPITNFYYINSLNCSQKTHPNINIFIEKALMTSRLVFRDIRCAKKFIHRQNVSQIPYEKCLYRPLITLVFKQDLSQISVQLAKRLNLIFYY